MSGRIDLKSVRLKTAQKYSNWLLFYLFFQKQAPFSVLSPLKRGIFRKPTRPPLPLREAPPLTPALSPSGEREETALLGARNRYALRMADHQRSRQIVRDGTAGVLVGIRVLFPVLQVLLLLLSVLLSLQILLPLLLWMWYREN